jgi:hypothetical protein
MSAAASSISESYVSGSPEGLCNVHVKTLSGDLLMLECEPTVKGVWHALHEYDSEQYPLHQTDVYPIPTDEDIPLYMVVVVPNSSVYFGNHFVLKTQARVCCMSLTETAFEMFETSDVPDEHHAAANCNVIPHSIDIVYSLDEEGNEKKILINHAYGYTFTCCMLESYDTLDEHLDHCVHHFSRLNETTYIAFRLTDEAKTSIKRMIRLHK